MVAVTSARLMFRVVRGALVPADACTTDALREKGLRVGDIVSVELRKPRNPGFWRLAHSIGAMCVRNLDDFSGLSAHQALKKIQFDADIECERTETVIPGVGVMIHRKPKSLSFESMDQASFHAVARAMCRHIAERYWPDLDEERVAEMARIFIDEG